jgi:hypothetical protein
MQEQRHDERDRQKRELTADEYRKVATARGRDGMRPHSARQRKAKVIV